MKVYDNSKIVRMPYLKARMLRVSVTKEKTLNTLLDAAQESDKKELGINFINVQL